MGLVALVARGLVVLRPRGSAVSDESLWTYSLDEEYIVLINLKHTCTVCVRQYSTARHDGQVSWMSIKPRNEASHSLGVGCRIQRDYPELPL